MRRVSGRPAASSAVRPPRCRWLTRFSSSSWRPETRTGLISPSATRCSSSASETSPSRIDVPSVRVPAGVALVAPVAARSSRPRSGSRRRAGRARACRARRCGRGRDRSGRLLWRRSLASKLKPPGASPPSRRISYSGITRSSTEFGNWSVSQPFCGSPRLASMLPRMPLATANATSWWKLWPASVAWLASMLTRYSSSRPCLSRKP